MNGKKRLKIVLLGVVILINIAVIGIVLYNPNEYIISQVRNEIETKLSENSSMSEEESELIVKDSENMNDNIEDDENIKNDIESINDEIEDNENSSKTR